MNLAQVSTADLRLLARYSDTWAERARAELKRRQLFEGGVGAASGKEQRPSEAGQPGAAFPLGRWST